MIKQNMTLLGHAVLKEEVRNILIRKQKTAWGPQVYLLILGLLRTLPLPPNIQQSVTESVNNELERI